MERAELVLAEEPGKGALSGRLGGSLVVAVVAADAGRAGVEVAAYDDVVVAAGFERVVRADAPVEQRVAVSGPCASDRRHVQRDEVQRGVVAVAVGDLDSHAA